MDTWNGFFQPQIHVKSKISGSSTLSPGDCEFIQPTRVKAYLACCDRSNIQPITIESNNRCKSGSISCICAKRVFTCDTDLNPNPLLGCYLLPLPPPPPPFCDVFQTQTNIRIVPVKESSFFSPKIKIIVGLDGKKRHNNNSLDEDESSNYKSMILSLNSNGTSKGIERLSFGDTEYMFEAKKRENQICGLYYKDSKFEPYSSVCFDIPKMNKPIINSYPDDIANILKKGENIVVQATVNGYNNNKSFNLFYTKSGILHNDTKLKLIRPKINDEHFFERELLCYNSLGKYVKGVFTEESVKCPDGYKNEKIAYKEDPKGRVLCISEEEISEYMLNRGNRIFRFAEIGRAFIPHQYNSITNEWEVNYSTIPNNLFIEDTPQDEIDIIQNIGANLFVIYPTKKGGHYNAKYKQVESFARLENFPEKTRNNFIATHLSKSEALKYNIIDGSIAIVITNFVNIEDNTAFFLTREEQEKAQYIPTDPNLRGLCIHDFPFQVFDDPNKNQLDNDLDNSGNFFNAQECDFVTIEAWGGGASGHIDTLEKSKHGKSFSGASGGYTKGTIKIKPDQHILKMEIGSGGNIPNKAGQTTKVYLCDNNKENCDTLLSANGGRSNREEAKEIDLNNKDQFNRKLVLFVDTFPGLQGKYEISDKKNPDVAQPRITEKNLPGGYINWKSTLCSQSDSMNEVTSVIPSTETGQGGCVSKEKNLWQPGSNGKVKITCEIWRD